MKSGRKEKIIVLLAGVLFAVVAVEGGLRLLGLFYDKRPEIEVYGRPGGIKVLCLGDSFTMGLGAPGRESYPAQLQTLLTAKRPELKFSVVNRGVSTQNSSQLLAELKGDIRAFKPNFVVVMTGGANNWNRWGYEAAMGRRDLAGRAREWLTGSGVFKLFKLLGDRAHDRLDSVRVGGAAEAQAGFILLGLDKPSDALKRFRSGIEAGGGGVLNFAGAGLAAMRDGNPAEAAGWFLREKAAAGESPSLYFRLGTAYRLSGNGEKAGYWHKLGVKSYPSYGLNYSALALLYSGQRRYDEAKYWMVRALGKRVSHSSRAREDAFALTADLGALVASVKAAGPGHGGESRTIPDYNSPLEKTVGMQFYFSGRAAEAADWFKDRITKFPWDISARLGLGMALSDCGRQDQAVTAFLDGISMDPGDSEGYYQIGKILNTLNRPEEALQWFKAGVRAGPGNRENESYLGLSVSMADLGLHAAGESFFLEAARENPALADLAYSLKKGRAGAEEKYLWIENDLKRIAATCREEKVRLILMNYPEKEPTSERARLAALILAAAGKSGVMSIDNYGVFNSFRKNGATNGYFSPDGHCNGKGYALISEMVSSEILSRIGD